MARPYKCLSIDDLTRRDHYYLTPDDECLYFMEYTSGKNYAYSAANNLISNFKKPVNRPDLASFKNGAIRQVSEMFTASLAVHQPDWTVVPIPPSKSKQHPLYDDRMTRCLQRYLAGEGDLRELLINKEDRQAAHESDVRPTIAELVADLTIDESLTRGVASNIALFDDVLTAGTHFKAAKQVLLTRFPGARVVGIFVARRVLPPPADFFTDLALDP